MQLADRIKMYEKAETSDKFMPMIPIYARLDGRSFSKFTKNLVRPYDIRLSEIMQEVTKFLVKETGARIGYTQSDEISLVWLQKSLESDVFFSAKKQKMISMLAALATAKFVSLALDAFPEECKRNLPTFDCRVFQVPSKVESVNCFQWRLQDAVRNSIQMAGRSEFSQSQLHLKSTKDILDMLINTKGINWNEYPKFFKEGTFFQRCTYRKDADNEEGYVIRSRIDEVLKDVPFDSLSTEEKVLLFFGE